MEEKVVQEPTRLTPKAVLRAVVTRADGTVDDYGIVAHHNRVIDWLCQIKIRYKNWRYLRRQGG